MATDVVMPQMGESIAEGTIVRWIKNVGDQVGRDEPLFEISTDKVDAEIPSPAAGIVDEIRVQAGETVPVNSVVAVIRQPGERQSEKTVAGGAAVTAQPPRRPGRDETVGSSPAGSPPVEKSAAREVEDRIRQRSSPLVRSMAKEHNLDISRIPGSGIAGRVTKQDVLDALARRTTPPVPRDSAGAPVGPSGHVEPMSVMRKKIAEHMLLSRRTSAHVHSVFEVDFFEVARIRNERKSAYEKAGVKVSYLSFIMKAVVTALKAVPVVNASIDGDNVVYHDDVNLGIAVALDWGLVVPVIKKADACDLLELSRAVVDLAARARGKQLKPDEVTGGTFTITNPGSMGTLFGMPIIHQPQVAILAVGSVDKRAVVVDDAVVVRPMAYLTLGYDHRLIDGAVADEFLSLVKNQIQNWDAAQT